MNGAARRVTATTLPSQTSSALLGRPRGRRRASRDDHGATSVEYAIMVSLIALVIIASVILFGQNATGLFNVPTSAFHL